MSTNDRTFRYRAHGLIFDSTIELPDCVTADGVPDVSIRYGEVPPQLDPPFRSGARYQASAGHYLLNIPGVARYWVTGGRRVIVAPAAGATDEGIGVFLLSSVTGALAHQRGILAVHASAVEVDGQCVLFAGRSGAGKSTLAAALHARGHRFVTDDISLVSLDGDGYPVVPHGHRHVKLRTDALDRVATGLGASRKLRGGTQKYIARARGAEPEAPLRLACLYVLSNQSASAIALHRLSARATVTTLIRETYRRRMLIALGQSHAHFAQCMAVGSRLAAVTVERPRDLDALPQLAGAIEDDVRANAAPGGSRP